MSCFFTNEQALCADRATIKPDRISGAKETDVSSKLRSRIFFRSGHETRCIDAIANRRWPYCAAGNGSLTKYTRTEQKIPKTSENKSKKGDRKTVPFTGPLLCTVSKKQPGKRAAKPALFFSVFAIDLDGRLTKIKWICPQVPVYPAAPVGANSLASLPSVCSSVWPIAAHHEAQWSYWLGRGRGTTPRTES